MRGISFWFFFTATLYVVAGMVWGIVMAASGDHTLAPAHAHLNLIGWVTMALFGVYYHVVPEAGEHWIARIQFAVATAGLLIMIPGIVLALRQADATFAKIGALLTLLSMVLFAINVWRSRQVTTHRALALGAET
jgi:hypothetical protein